MITAAKVIELSKQQESAILEFKRQWYWNDETSNDEKNILWGEFLKDLIALANAYIGYVGKKRFLLIGISESDQQFHDIDISKTKELRDIKKFRQKIQGKLEALTNPSLINFDLSIINIDGKNILAIEIPSPTMVISLSKEVTTKTKHIDQGHVLLRRGQKSDEVRTASFDEIELLRKEFNSNTSNDEDDFQVTRSILSTVQQYINQNSSCTIADNYPKSRKDWTTGIIFEIFKLNDVFGDERNDKVFLYIHENATQKNTYGYLKSHGLLPQDLNFLILLTERPKGLKTSDRRIENLKELFETKNVFFIDQFGKTFLYKKCISHYEKFAQPIFVDSLSDEIVNGKSSAIEILNEWYNSQENAIAVVKGHGGIGKTTLAKQFLDIIYETQPDIGVFFIVSSEIIDELEKNARLNQKIDDIYDFYQAQNKRGKSDSTSFTRDLFQLSVDNGSVIIVLDGIDEAIAKLGSKFDVNAFINKISTHYCSNIKNAKILITCRDYFWDSINIKAEILQISLKAFNADLAQTFFAQHFGDSSVKISRAMILANGFAINGQLKDQVTYIPYVLDMIAYLIKSQSETDDNNFAPIIESEILNINLSNDYIIYQVCHRELKKLNNMCVDDQIKLFMNLTASAKGNASLYDVKSLASETRPFIDDSIIEKLKGHPILNCSDNKIYFRYDFFYEFFRSLIISNAFKNHNVNLIMPNSIDILVDNVRFDDSFSNSVCSRINYDDGIIIFAIDLIEKINDPSFVCDNEDTRKRAVSSVFSLLLTLLKNSPAKFDAESCTSMLTDVFKISENTLSGVCLINLTSRESNKPIFNFKGLVIKESTFDNYEFFWDCLIDDKTRFLKSDFINLTPRRDVNPKVFELTFDQSCNTEGIQDVLTSITESANQKQQTIHEKLVKFFRLFFEHGNFYPQKQQYIRGKVFTGELLPVLLKNGVIVDYIDPLKPTLKQYKVADSYKPICRMFDQSTTCIEIDRVARLFK